MSRSYTLLFFRCACKIYATFLTPGACASQKMCWRCARCASVLGRPEHFMQPILELSMKLRKKMWVQNSNNNGLFDLSGVADQVCCYLTVKHWIYCRSTCSGYGQGACKGMFLAGTPSPPWIVKDTKGSSCSCFFFFKHGGLNEKIQSPGSFWPLSRVVSSFLIVSPTFVSR